MNSIRKLKFIGIVSSVFIGPSLVAFLLNKDLVIKSEVALEANSPNGNIYVIAFSGSTPETIIGQVLPNRNVKFINGELNSSDSYAIIVTNGINVFWDGKVKTGIFGGAEIDITSETMSHRLLPSKFMDLLPDHYQMPLPP